MAIISIIAAMDRNRLIGVNNQLPWRLPADLKHFKETTMAKPIIMGRKTWESLGRPLPGRQNIVITRNKDYLADGATLVHSLEEAVQTVNGEQEVMIIGGANLYQQALPVAQRMYLTRVDAEFEGDAWFPPYSADDWRLVESDKHQPDEKNGHMYEFCLFERVV